MRHLVVNDLAILVGQLQDSVNLAKSLLAAPGMRTITSAR
jgi:hypothetical protein